MGELREIATSLSFAHQDVNIFPKFCFLNKSLNMLLEQETPTGAMPLDLDYMGFALTGQIGRIMSDWHGGYFAFSGSRAGVTQGRGGVVRVVLPYANEEIEWPADPWGNPYVLYLLYINSEGTVDFILEPNQEPDFAASVVSYGPNRVVGSSPNLTADLAVLEGARLYSGKGYTGDPYRLLNLNEYTLERARRYFDPQGIEGGAVTAPGSDDIYYEF